MSIENRDSSASGLRRALKAIDVLIMTCLRGFTTQAVPVGKDTVGVSQELEYFMVSL